MVKFEVGDVVMFKAGATEYEVLATYKEKLWVRSLRPGSNQAPHTRDAALFRRVPIKKKGWAFSARSLHTGMVIPRILAREVHDDPPYIGETFRYGPHKQWGYEVVGRAVEVEYEESME